MSKAGCVAVQTHFTSAHLELCTL